MQLRKGAILVSIIAAVVAGADPGPISSAARDEDWQSDVDFLRTELPARHPNPFSKRPRWEFEADLEQLRVEVPTLTDGEVLIRLQQAAASLGDAHTEVDWRPAVTTGYPLRLRWFSDGLFVTKTSPGAALACGARITGIDELGIGDVYDRVATVISHDNPHWARFRSPQFLVGHEILRALGINSEDRAEFRFESVTGDRFSMPFVAAPIAQVSNVIYAPVEQTGETPLYLRSPGLNYWFSWIPENRLMYVKYNVCRDSPSESFAAFTKRLFTLVDRERPERLVVDIRNNSGGSSAVINPLIDAIRARSWLDQPDRLFVIIGPQTFSSAVLNALTFRRNTRATLVGEPTGGNANGYGEVRSFVLPKRRVTVWHSTKYFDIDAANPGAVVPDIPIETSSEDYFSSRDPVLEGILTGTDQMLGGDENPTRRHRAVARRPPPRVCR